MNIVFQSGTEYCGTLVIRAKALPFLFVKLLIFICLFAPRNILSGVQFEAFTETQKIMNRFDIVNIISYMMDPLIRIHQNDRFSVCATYDVVSSSAIFLHVTRMYICIVIHINDTSVILVRYYSSCVRVQAHTNVHVQFKGWNLVAISHSQHTLLDEHRFDDCVYAGISYV